MEKMVTWGYLHHHHIIIPPTYFSITFQRASKQSYPSTPSSKPISVFGSINHTQWVGERWSTQWEKMSHWQNGERDGPYHALSWPLCHIHWCHANHTIYHSSLIRSCNSCIWPLYPPEVTVLLWKHLLPAVPTSSSLPSPFNQVKKAS
jgi:hypothetical protein